jgi:hypothetical protein
LRSGACFSLPRRRCTHPQISRGQAKMPHHITAAVPAVLSFVSKVMQSMNNPVRHQVGAPNGFPTGVAAPTSCSPRYRGSRNPGSPIPAVPESTMHRAAADRLSQLLIDLLIALSMLSRSCGGYRAVTEGSGAFLALPRRPGIEICQIGKLSLQTRDL